MKIGITMYETSFPTFSKKIIVPHYGEYPLTDVLIYNHVQPLLLPSVKSFTPKLIQNFANQIDGLILGGGDDIDPSTYGESTVAPVLSYPARDNFEIAMFKRIKKERKPILGVCRGCQMIDVALGGTLYQNIYSQLTHHRLINHDGSYHSVQIKPGSQLYKTLGSHQIVNSRHHQAIKTLGRNLQVVARASDHIVEGIESRHALIQGVQWHPENLWRTNAAQNNLFRAFFKRVKFATD